MSRATPAGRKGTPARTAEATRPPVRTATRRPVPRRASRQAATPRRATRTARERTDAAIEAESGSGAEAGTDAVADAPPDSPCGTVFLQDSFADDAAGWTLDTSWSIAPECVNPPAPAKGYPDPTSDHTGAAGSGVLGAYVCGNNPTGATVPARYATSPAVDTSDAPSLKLAFWRFLNTDEASYTLATVDVFDGAHWVNVYSNPASPVVTDAAWTRQEYDVTAEKNAAFRVRFGLTIPSKTAYVMSSWNVDDVVLSTVSCP